MKKITLLFFSLFIFGQALLAQEGTIDPSFSGITTGFNSYIRSIITLPDGKIFVAGDFNEYNGASCSRGLVRLNTDGSIDNTFNPSGSGFNYYVLCLKIQTDGKILVGGNFQTYNGSDCPDMLVRLNADGSIDNTFNASGSGFDDDIYSIEIQTDGKILVGGNFVNYNGVNCQDRLVRLNSNGSVDNTFNPSGSGFDNYIYSLKILTDGKILVGGNFQTYNGSDCQDRLVRLNADGSIDNAFNNLGSGFSTYVYSIAIQNDGKILAGGEFTTYNGADCPDRLARLNSDGSLDNTFNTDGSGFNNFIFSLLIQNNGRILVAGPITSFNGTPCSQGLVRLNSDGSLDNTFNTDGSGFSNYVYSICLQSDGNILAGGNFSSFNGSSCPSNFVRLFGTPITAIPTLAEWGILLLITSLIILITVYWKKL